MPLQQSFPNTSSFIFILLSSQSRHYLKIIAKYIGASQVAPVVKNPPANVGRYKRCRFNPRRRAWQPSPLFLPGESHGQRSVVGYSPWCPRELNMTEVTERAHMPHIYAYIYTYTHIYIQNDAHMYNIHFKLPFYLSS